MEKKLSLAIFLAFFVLFSQQAFAQSSCGLVNFTDDSFTLNSSETKNINFTVKNFGTQDFFIDELAVENNPFFFSEKISGKIFEGTTSLMTVKVVASAVEQTEFILANASIIGHFEDGQRCFVEKEFYFQINPAQKPPEGPLNIAVSAWNEVDATGSGFVFLQAINDSPKAIEIVIESRGARLGVDSVWVEAFSFKRQAITINGADDNELVFFKVYSGGKLLFEKFTQVKYPAKEEDGGITFEEKDPSAPVFISSYSQKVEFVNDKTEAWVVLENKSSVPVEVFVELRNLPQGVTSIPVSGIVLPGQKKQFGVQVSGKSSEEFFSAIISVNGNEFSLNRLVLFEQKTEAPVVGQAEPGTNFGSAAFLFLSQNSLGLLVLIVALVVLALAFSEKSKDSLQVWVAQK